MTEGSVAARRRPVRRRTGRVALLATALGGAASAAPLAVAILPFLNPALEPATRLTLIAIAAAISAGAVVALLRLLRPLTEIAALFDRFSGVDAAQGRGDEFSRIARGVRSLEARLEHAARRADPARLEDPLTGLPNRLAVMRRARDEIARARRKALGLSVALFEIDGFELFAAADDPGLGDRALRLTAETLVQTLRAYDIVGRWGGATFVAVLPESEVEHAVDAMRRVRDRLAEEPSARLGGMGVTASAGVAVLQPDDATLADVAERAAAALTKARSRGVGRIEAAPGPRTRPGKLTSV